MSFKLSPKFLEKYEGRQPNWGFGDLSYFTYKRTYARLMDNGKQEEFVDTCKRVTEGVFSIQEQHCRVNRIPWNAHQAQKSAQEFFTRMWEFKFSPPGRGFWIMGTPIVDKIGSASLQNCFGYETEIITYEGIKKIGELVNTKQTLLSFGGEWIESDIKSYGKQKLYNITLSRCGIKKNIRATANHRWFAADRRKLYRDKKYSEFTTIELRPGAHTLQYSFGKGIKDIVPSPFGIAHGFTFGDGCARGGRNSAVATLIGEKDMALAEYFRLCPNREIPNGVEYSAIPNFFKKLPDLKENKTYLLGWLSGYFAADGSCKSDGSCILSSTSIENIRHVRDVCSILGIGTYSIKEETRFSNLTNDYFTMYSICLMRKHLMPEFFLIKHHKENFILNGESDITIANWTVDSVEETTDFETVYCAEVPDKNSFALADNILTGNCGFRSTKDLAVDFAAPFAWSMDMLMLGVGVGFDTKGAGKVKIKGPNGPDCIYLIPDTREGWVESVKILLSSYATNIGRWTFDYSQIRKKGEPIKGFGGVASGPAPLEELHNSIRRILDTLVGQYITSVAITDIFNLIGKCVVSGNVRRSAEIAIGEENDLDFISMKDYRKFSNELISHRWASNNSLFVTNNSDFTSLADLILLNGEPGLIFLENSRHYGRFKDGFLPEESERYDNVQGFNPCSEQQLEDKELCCLVETYPANHEDEDDFKRTLKFAYMYAKTVSLVPTHDEGTNSVMMRNRRIGCSLSGVQQAIKKFGYRKFIQKFADEGYTEISRWDRIYSRWFAVPRSIRMTTIKPSGTVSLLAGATPGVHCTHSEYYLRTIRLAGNSPYLLTMIEAGYRIEPSVNDRDKLKAALLACGYNAEDSTCESFETYKQFDPILLQKFGELGGTVVVYFPIKERNFTKSKFDISIWEQLNLVRELQYYWSDNSVSCTITVKDNEKQDLLPAIQYFAPYVKTMSFLPLTNHRYAQAPYQEISKEQYEEYASKLKALNLSEAAEAYIKGSKFCTNDSCEI